jgi:hypothetical protein
LTASKAGSDSVSLYALEEEDCPPTGKNGFPFTLNTRLTAVTEFLLLKNYVVVILRLFDFNPGEVAVMLIGPGFALDCTIARHRPLNAFLRLM